MLNTTADTTGSWIGPFTGVSKLHHCSLTLRGPTSPAFHVHSGTAEVCEAGLLTRIVLGVFVVLRRAFATAQHALALVQLGLAKLLLDRLRDIFRGTVCAHKFRLPPLSNLGLGRSWPAPLVRELHDVVPA
eukprot:scaffold82690_cov95-Phaeocystis_antarctica.AAC.1